MTTSLDWQIPPDDYLFYLKLDQLNTLKANYMRAVKCGVFQLLTVVNELMSFKRQHDNDYSLRVHSSLLITKNMAQWTQMRNVSVLEYAHRWILVTEHECFSLYPDMDVIRLVGLSCFGKVVKTGTWFCNLLQKGYTLLALVLYITQHVTSSQEYYFFCGDLDCNHIKPTLGFIAAFKALLEKKSISSKYVLCV